MDEREIQNKYGDIELIPSIDQHEWERIRARRKARGVGPGGKDPSKKPVIAFCLGHLLREKDDMHEQD